MSTGHVPRTIETPMPDVLAQILAHKRTEVEAACLHRPVEILQAEPAYHAVPRDFYAAVTRGPTPAPRLIAEIKKASPSAGVIATDFDPVSIAGRYYTAGAAALSILTDARFFQGDLSYLQLVRARVPLPVLRKDFLIDAYQVHESRAAGADAVLLIAEALAPALLAELASLARSLSLTVLIEVHSEDSLRAVLAALGPQRSGILLGINNRNLATQTTDISNTERLARLVPSDLPIVSESGIRMRADVLRMRAAGAAALLIGEALMRSDDPVQAIRALFQDDAAGG